MPKIIVSLLITLFCSACAPTKNTTASNASTYNTYVKTDSKSVLLIDVRESSELAESGTIAQAIHVPLSDINSNGPQWQALITQLKAAQPNKTFSHIGVFCRSGVRSGKAVERIKDFGFAADNLGGFKDLVNAGFSTTQTGLSQ